MKESTYCGGRICVKVPNHPHANNRGYIPRSRYVMEQYLGRILNSTEHVHHKNRNKIDDRIENLELISNSNHMKIHNNLPVRILNYNFVTQLRSEGLGYKRIAKKTGYDRSSIRYALKIMGVKKGIDG